MVPIHCAHHNILDALAKAEIVYMSVFVIGELYAGFRGGTREHKNRKILKKFLKKPTVKVLNATRKTADIFGTIKNNLKKAGTPLPINDVWIASHSIEKNAVIISYDLHFKKIQGLHISFMIFFSEV
jgi:tRNA(fMet)-specific endonuclease VapC